MLGDLGIFLGRKRLKQHLRLVKEMYVEGKIGKVRPKSRWLIVIASNIKRDNVISEEDAGD